MKEFVFELMTVTVKKWDRWRGSVSPSLESKFSFGSNSVKANSLMLRSSSQKDSIQRETTTTTATTN
jgi:hypothetical protein